MTKPTRIEVDCLTGMQRVVDLTDEEIAQREADAARVEQDKIAADNEIQAKADAKLNAQAKLQALGLTGEEIAAITN